MQVNPSNPMTGIDGRATLLSNLAKALRNNATYFGEGARPGNIVGEQRDFICRLVPVRFWRAIGASKNSASAMTSRADLRGRSPRVTDFLESQSKENNGSRSVHVSALWHVLIDGLSAIWPASRTTLGGVPLGDVWPCSALRRAATKAYSEGDDLVPFHKLTGWTAYSLLEPLQVILKWKIDGLEDLTGLPEYRNGQSLEPCLSHIQTTQLCGVESRRELYAYCCSSLIYQAVFL